MSALRRTAIASGIAHAVIVALALRIHPRVANRTVPTVATVEMDIAPMPETHPVTVRANPPALAAGASPRAAVPPTGPHHETYIPRVEPPRGVPTVSIPAVPGVSPAVPALNGLALLRAATTDVDHLVGDGEVRLATVPTEIPVRDMVPREQGTELERAEDNSAGYIRRMLAETHQHEAPGVRAYYWYLRRRMEERWTPGITRQPTMLDALVSAVAMSPAAMNDVLTAAQGQFLTPGPAGAAADALDNAHGPWGSPQTPYLGIVDASHGNARTTIAEVEVTQDADGTVQSVRIVQSSHLARYDQAALDAVQAALRMQPPVAMPGGRRSRWSFQVRASRDPFVPGVGMEFDESTGWFEVHYPGRLHLRTRVWLEHAMPMAPQGSRQAG